MIISIIGNCQIDALFNFMKKANLNVTRLPVHSSSESQVKEFQERVRQSDVLISTLTKDDYKNNIGVGSNYLRSLLPRQSFCVVIPCLYYNGYYPTVSSFSEFDALLFNHKYKTFHTSKYHDYIPLILAEHKLLDLSYEKMFASKNLDIETIVKKHHEKSIKELQEREQYCDIIMSDFLITNYNKEQCFLTPNHPKNNILFEMYKRILHFIKNKTSKEIQLGLSSTEDVINPKDDITIHKFVQDSICIKEICDHAYTDYDFNQIVKFYFEKNTYPNQPNGAYNNAKKILELAGVL